MLTATIPKAQQNAVEEAKPVIFVIGPWARKWFTNVQSAQARWIVVPEDEDLQKTLSHLRRENQCVEVNTFFPFLPDGQEDDELTLAQLAKWQRKFQQAEAFPCVFAVYARLSKKPSPHHLRYNWWSGRYEINKRVATTMESEARQLLTVLKQHAAGNEHAAIHRYVMADALFLWMKKSGVMAALQSLFSTTSLRLSAVLLADYGDGFVRHGAWARWINKTFQLYPGLSSTVVRPPLPSVVAGCPKVKASTFPAKASPFWRWLPVSLALLIAFYLTSAAWLQSQHIKEAKLALAAFTQADVIRPETRREAFERLSRQGQKLSGSCKNSLTNLWGEKNCQKMLDKIETALRHYKSLPALFASVPVALFAPGSAVIQPGSEEKLLMLLPLLSSARQTTFMVTGHSDNTGTDQLNRQISIQRATAVRDWLVRHTRLPAENFIIKGMGDAVPVASNETEAGRRKNRRVELIPLSQ